MILIINYGLGNLSSVLNMVSKMGGEASIISDPIYLSEADKIILPGVGAFDQGMTNLYNGKWIDALNNSVFKKKIPILGICLGMQLMCKSSEEGHLHGLGWINAEVKRFKFSPNSTLKIPHMGWNKVNVTEQNLLIDDIDDGQRFYFVHSYHVECNDLKDIIATTDYGYDFTSAFNHNNIYGVQFHPEKSHRYGKIIMKKFIDL